MHLKRYHSPKNWPIPRKGTAYVVKPKFNIKNGVPLLIILRDILKIVKNRKEAKKAIHSKSILLNNKVVKDEKNSAMLFDVIEIVPAKEYYKLSLKENGKFKMEKINKQNALYKIAKIINKKTLKGKKTQLNMSDGENFIEDLKCKINDSVLINLKERKIEKCLPLKEGEKALVFAGKHSGQQGIIKKIIPERKMAKLEVNKNKINILIKQLIVIK